MKKIALIISNPIYIRNYILSKSYKDLTKNYNLSLLFPQELNSIKNIYDINKYDNYFYKYPIILTKLAKLNNDLSLFSNKEKSPDFSFRIKRKFNYKKFSQYQSYKNGYIYRAKVFLKILVLNLISKSILTKYINYLSRIIFNKLSPIQKIVNENLFDFVICPSSAAGTEEFDISSSTKFLSNNCKTILLIDNWDNLSSKYIMCFKPNHIAVWGEQTKFHAISIQNILPKNITVIGTPRFAKYKKKINKKLLLNYPELPENYFLFCGTQTYFDEEKLLLNILKIIKNNFPKYKLIYRPHPWRESLSRKKKISKEIILDPTLNFKSESIGGLNLPNVDLYNYIISNSKLIIGGTTSMIVESSIFRKPYLLIAYDDGNPIQSPYECFIRREHQKLTALLNNVEICFDYKEIYNKIRYLINKKIPKNDKVLDYIISNDCENYSKNLLNLIDKLDK